METDPLAESWSPLQVAALHALQAWAVGHAEMNQHLGRWMGLPTSDANALGHVVWAEQDGEPLSPAQLSRRIGMTSGATTTLVDRLERAGLVVRSRESSDRRRVALRPTPDGRERARAFTVFAGQELAAAVRAAGDAELEAVVAFGERLNRAVATANERLHLHEQGAVASSAPSSEAPAPPSSAAPAPPQ